MLAYIQKKLQAMIMKGNGEDCGLSFSSVEVPLDQSEAGDAQLVSLPPEEAETLQLTLFETNDSPLTPDVPNLPLHQNPELVSQPSRRRSRLRKASGYIVATVCGMTFTVGAGGIAWHMLNDDNGETIEYPATVSEHPKIDSELVIASYNAEGIAAEEHKRIERLFKEEHVDALAMQEVTANDASILHAYLPDKNIVVVKASGTQHAFDGGYVDLWITNQPPKNIEAKSIQGTGYFETLFRGAGLVGQDVASAATLHQDGLSLNNTSEALEEGRAALKIEIPVLYKDKLVDVVLITGHIAGRKSYDYKTHDRQYGEYRQYAAENVKKGRPIFEVGDENELNDKAREMWTEQTSPAFSTTDVDPNSPPTSDGGKAIDRAAYRTEGIFETPVQTSIDGGRSDHDIQIITARTKFSQSDPSYTVALTPMPATGSIKK
jgi:exonuclease III